MECKWQKYTIDAILLPSITVGAGGDAASLNSLMVDRQLMAHSLCFPSKPQGFEIYSRTLYWLSLNPVLRRVLGKPYDYS